MLPSKERLDKRRQHGEALLEALIGMLLMMIIGLGLSHATARATVSQRDMNLQNIVVGQMRNLIVQRGAKLCTDDTLPAITTPIGTFGLEVTCSDLTVSVVTASGVPMDSKLIPQRVALSTLDTEANNLIFGGQITVGH